MFFLLYPLDVLKSFKTLMLNIHHTETDGKINFIYNRIKIIIKQFIVSIASVPISNDRQLLVEKDLFRNLSALISLRNIIG